MQLAHEHLREKVITGSEIAALFNQHPYMTRFKLWHKKRGTLEDKPIDGHLSDRGHFLEDGVAQWAAKQLGAKIQPTAVFLQRQDMPLLGGTPDRYITIGGELALLEVKTMNFWAARKYEDRDIPPAHYAMQTKLYTLLKGLEVGYLAIYFLGDDELKIYDIRPTEEERAEYIKAAAEFWQSIESGEEPEVTGDDIETLKELGAGKEGEGIIDLSGKNFLVDRCGQYIENARTIKTLEAAQDGLKADILHETLGMPCKKVILGDYMVNFTHRAASPDRVITQDMVGEVLKGRAGSVSLTIKKGK